MAKRAVLVGCNYPGTKDALEGCVNDVIRMHRCLITRFGFEEDDIDVLIDTDDSYTLPTGKNIRKALSKLVRHAHPGDVLFFHYSGHGTRLPVEHGEYDDTGYDECIVPTDGNLIIDDDFREFVDQVPEDCRFTIVSDSCHSGGLIDEAKEQIGESYKGEKQEDSNDEQEDGDDDEDEDDDEKVEEDDDDNNDGDDGDDEEVEEETDDDNDNDEEVEDEEQDDDDDDDDDEDNNEEVDDEEQDDDDDDYSNEDNSEDDEDSDDYNGHRYKSRSLPLPSLIEILKQKTGKDDISASNLRAALFDIFGEDASQKVQKFKSFTLANLQLSDNEGTSNERGGFTGMVNSFTHEFEKNFIKTRKVFARSTKHAFLDSGILISGCQTSQTSADVLPTKKTAKAYGALSNAILTILAESDGPVTNRELVLMARDIMKQKNYSQRPGLYCSDDYVNEPFVC